MFMNDMSHPGQTGLVAYPEHTARSSTLSTTRGARSGEESRAGTMAGLAGANSGVHAMSYAPPAPDVPTLTAWTAAGNRALSPAPPPSSRRAQPYYWKVDANGQQYPYADKVQVKLVANVQSALLEAAAGNLTFQRYHISGLPNRAFHIENSKKGNYRIQDIKDSWANSIAILVNRPMQGRPQQGQSRPELPHRLVARPQPQRDD